MRSATSPVSGSRRPARISQQRRLAGAVRSDQAQPVALANAERNIFEQKRGAVGFRKRLGVKEQVHREVWFQGISFGWSGAVAADDFGQDSRCLLRPITVVAEDELRVISSLIDMYTPTKSVRSASRALLFAFACSLVCSHIRAADNPFIGTWKENDAKSYYSRPTQGKFSMIRVEDAGENRVRITIDQTRADGTKAQMSSTNVLDGSEAPMTGSTFILSFRPISSNSWDHIEKHPDGSTAQRYWAVSNDGKTLFITGFGTTPDGKKYYFHRALDKQ